MISGMQRPQATAAKTTAAGKGRHVAARIAIHGIILIISLIFVFPLLWMVSSSFKPIGEIFDPGLTIVPRRPTLENYQVAFAALPLLRNFFNSVFVATTFTALSLFFSSLAGFAFAKMQFPGRNSLFLLLLGTMMVPTFVTLLPSFVIISKLGWVDTYQALIVPGVANAFGIFFMRQYIQEVPDELLDAARIDGGSSFTMYRQIVLPLVKPALTALAIMQFMGTWNNFLWPLMVIRSNEMYPIVLAVAALPAANFNTPWGAVMAGTTVAVVPLVLFFLAFQKQFVAGVMRIGLKG